MNRIRITKEFKFEMAHALMNYDGLCKNVHGHSYQLKITVIGKPNMEKGHPKHGMVMDFGDLRRIVKDHIVDVFDHALVLNSAMPAEVSEQLKASFEKVILLDYQPTSELMVIDFATRLQANLPESVKLVSVLLRETVTSYAEWLASDQI